MKFSPAKWFAVGALAAAAVLTGTFAAASTIPNSPAFTSDSLSTGIGKTDAAISLVRGTDGQGSQLSGYYGFVIDEGTASQEVIACNATGALLTSCARGLDLHNGTTTVTALELVHRRGASVKITTFPVLGILAQIFQGINGIPNLIHYDAGVDCTVGHATNALCTATYLEQYANNVVAGGAPTSTEATGGKVELGTLAEQASSFDGGAAKPTVLQTKNSTSTCQVVGSYNIVASTTTGKMDKGCFDQTANYTLSGTNTFSGGTITTSSSTANVGTLHIGNIVATAKFGGTGADGSLDTSGGTVNINLGFGQSVIKNYTSINISTGGLSFTNANVYGTEIILKSQGNCTIASNIYATSTGAQAGSNNGLGNIGYAGAGNNGVNGTVGSAAGGAASAATPFATSTAGKIVPLIPGASGGVGGAGAGPNGTPGTSGAGGGAVYIECGGSLNFTGTISVNGLDGGAGGTAGGTIGAGGGGGGGGGTVAIVYGGTLTANSGTINVAGGAAGGAGAVGSGSGGGGGGAAGGAGAFSGGAAGSQSSNSGTGSGGAGGAGGKGTYYIVPNTEF